MTANLKACTGPARTRPADVTAPDPAALATADHGERTRLLDQYVRQELGRILGIAPHQVDTTGRPMNSLGVGSIAGLELQHRMETALGVELHLQMLLLANSAAELVDCLVRKFAPAGDGPRHGAPVPV
ncbi:hypothetical protein ACVW0K_005798 [Streptomyces filamentosus]|uniref:acyl carrier protein n=1 Tax=Streptomyces filamentosus TaxID=67294 RepID=UPI0033FF322B